MIVSLALLGAFFGALMAGPTSMKIGLKPTILFSDLLFIVGSVMMSFAQSIYVLMGGRFIVGLGLGVDLMVTPLYLSEISPVKIRGLMVGCFVVTLTLGQFFSSLLAYYMAGNWRLMFGIGLVPAIIQAVLMLFMPES